MSDQLQQTDMGEAPASAASDRGDSVVRSTGTDPDNAPLSLGAHRRQREVAKLMEQIFARLREKL